MRKRYKISDIPLLINKPVFFDANVILYIFWPTGNNDFVYRYSSIFARLLKNKTKLYVNFIVLSEVVNRAIRIEYRKFIENSIDKTQFEYKDFRNSNEGKEAIDDIYQVLQRSVLSKFDITSTPYSKNDIIGFLKAGKLDFCDKGIELECKINDFILVTNDSDFFDSELEILSANRKLLTIS